MSKKCLDARILLIVKTSLNLQLRHSQIMVAAGIIEARITAAVLRDYDGMRVKKYLNARILLIVKTSLNLHIRH